MGNVFATAYQKRVQNCKKEAKTGMSPDKMMVSIFGDAEGVLLVDYLDTLSPEPIMLIFCDSYRRQSSRFGV